MGCSATQEQGAIGDPGPALLAIRSDGASDLGWKRQPVSAVTLAGDYDLALPPIDVVRIEVGDLRCA
jgi:hypothetical protein